jgi:hypothetical protein
VQNQDNFLLNVERELKNKNFNQCLSKREAAKKIPTMIACQYYSMLLEKERPGENLYFILSQNIVLYGHDSKNQNFIYFNKNYFLKNHP